MLKLYNTLSRSIEEFKPLDPSQVTMYTCGLTVYDYTHIGHLKKYTGDDILKKVLQANGYQVKHVMNVTDVGHLASDADTGEDKMEKGAKEQGRTVWEVARFFEEYSQKALAAVNFARPSVVCRATEHINAQIKLIKQLEKNGYTYITDHAVYFDVTKFASYTKLSRQKLEDKEVGSRVDVVIDKQKKHPADFSLWFFTVGHFKDHSMRWSSPWGEGFPGWHIECSAMAMEYLGETIDIHTGGIDHIPVHHTNEIAQSEAATGKQFVKYWIHHEFLKIDKAKMSKSLKNFLRLEDVEAKGFDPLALRYLFLTGHYRSELTFSWDSLQSAQNALNNLYDEVRNWDEPSLDVIARSQGDEAIPHDKDFYQRFLEVLNNDLNTPQALAIMWEMVKSDLPTSEKSAILLKMDEVFSLNLENYVATPLKIPETVQKLIIHRENARQTGDFVKSDELRKDIKKLGFEIEDSPTGPKLKPA